MGLLRTAARASVAAHVAGNVHRRQRKRWAAEEASRHPEPGAAAPSAPAAGTDAMLAQLAQLAQLRDSGVLSPAEFEAQKQRILAG